MESTSKNNQSSDCFKITNMKRLKTCIETTNDVPGNFITRNLFERDQHENVVLNFDEFMSINELSRIVVILDVDGSGKTFFAKEIQKYIVRKFTNDLIFFVDVRMHIKEFLDDPHDNFIKFITQISKFDEQSETILREKLETGNVKIILDGFSDFSFGFGKTMMDLLLNYASFNSKNQIFITTSEFLEPYFLHHQKLDGCKKINSIMFKFHPISDDELVEYFRSSWHDPNLSLELIKNCSILMVQKINEIFSLNIFGIFSIPECLVNTFRNKLDENFSKTIEFFSVSKIFEKLLTPEDVKSFIDYECLSVVELFDKQCVMKMMDITKIKTPQKSAIFYENFRFKHSIYAEYCTAKFIVDGLNDSKVFELFRDILTQKKFKCTRFFLNEMLANVDCKFSMDKRSYVSILKRSFFELLSDLLIFSLQLVENSRPEQMRGKVLKEFLMEELNPTDFYNFYVSTVKSGRYFSKMLKLFFDDEAVMLYLLGPYDNYTPYLLGPSMHFLRKSDGRFFFIFAAVAYGTNEDLNILFPIKQAHFGERESIIEQSRAKLLLEACKNKCIDSVKFLWDALEDKFSNDEYAIIFNDAFLFCLIENGTETTVSFVINKFKKYISKDRMLKLLMTSRFAFLRYKKMKIFNFLIEEIESEK